MFNVLFINLDNFDLADELEIYKGHLLNITNNLTLQVLLLGLVKQRLMTDNLTSKNQ